MYRLAGLCYGSKICLNDKFVDFVVVLFGILSRRLLSSIYFYLHVKWIWGEWHCGVAVRMRRTSVLWCPITPWKYDSVFNSVRLWGVWKSYSSLSPDLSDLGKGVMGAGNWWTSRKTSWIWKIGTVVAGNWRTLGKTSWIWRIGTMAAGNWFNFGERWSVELRTNDSTTVGVSRRKERE